MATTMETIKFTFKGESPLMMHSDRTVNKRDPLVREISKIAAVRKKTDEHYDQIARMEWEAGMYFVPKQGPVMPTNNLRACIIGGAKKSKLGAATGSCLLALAEYTPLKYNGPRDLDELWKAGFKDERTVVIGQSRVMRCRPKFDSWSISFEMLFDIEVIQREQLATAAEVAGRLVGLCEMRPEMGYGFGRFSVVAS